MVTRTIPRRDERVELIARDPAAYFADARRRALAAAERDVAARLDAPTGEARSPRARRGHAA